jgi:dihydroorotase
VPDEYRFGADAVVPLRAGETVFWRVAGSGADP